MSTGTIEGGRGYWQYTTDGGETVAIRLRDLHATKMNFEPADLLIHPIAEHTLHPRSVVFANDVGRTKRLAVPSLDSTWWQDSDFQVEIDGISWVSYKRFAERHGNKLNRLYLFTDFLDTGIFP